MPWRNTTINWIPIGRSVRELATKVSSCISSRVEATGTYCDKNFPRWSSSRTSWWQLAGSVTPRPATTSTLDGDEDEETAQSSVWVTFVASSETPAKRRPVASSKDLHTPPSTPSANSVWHPALTSVEKCWRDASPIRGPRARVDGAWVGLKEDGSFTTP